MIDRRSTLIFIATVSALVTGCGSQNSVKTKTAKEASFSQRLSALSPEWRNATLIRAINDSGQSCDRISVSAFQQTYKGLGMWHARCRDGGDWAIFIGENGNAQVASCSKDVGKPVPVCQPISADGLGDRRAAHSKPMDQAPGSG